jgi:site-specific recombinase XerC
VSKDSLLERVTTVADERHLSQNTLTAYRRTWLKLIAWATAEGLALETLPSDKADVLWVSTGFFLRVIDMAVAL